MELTTAMVADAAHVAGGKIYILGGQWNRLVVAEFPASHPAMAVALVLKVGFDDAPSEHRLTVQLMLGNEPQETKAIGNLRMGHAPAQTPGVPSFLPIVLPFYQIPFKAPGQYEWVITVGEKELGRIPIEVALADATITPTSLLF